MPEKVWMRQTERLLVDKMSMEHRLFQARMLLSGKIEIYHSCNKIHFWECIFEYFQNNDIDSSMVDACLGQRDLTGALWELYLKYENLQVSSWSGIDELLKVFFKEQRCTQKVS